MTHFRATGSCIRLGSYGIFVAEDDRRSGGADALAVALLSDTDNNSIGLVKSAVGCSIIIGLAKSRYISGMRYGRGQPSLTLSAGFVSLPDAAFAIQPAYHLKLPVRATGGRTLSSRWEERLEVGLDVTYW